MSFCKKKGKKRDRRTIEKFDLVLLPQKKKEKKKKKPSRKCSPECPRSNTQHDMYSFLQLASLTKYFIMCASGAKEYRLFA